MYEIHDPSVAFGARSCGPRTYRPLRQRTRVRSAVDLKHRTLARSGGGLMERVVAEDEQREVRTPITEKDAIEIDLSDMEGGATQETLVDRETLCLPHFERDAVVHGGESGFQDVLQQYFSVAESNASEQLVTLKSKLKSAETKEFWELLMEGMCNIMGAQCAFVAKRILVDDQDSAIEMPPLGEPGSCLMGIAIYMNEAGSKQHSRDYRYHAFGTPCAYMKHDKVFVVPERMSEFIRENPNPMPWKQTEAFIGIPLFTEGKSFAHFGMIWSLEGARQRPKCSWSFIEMFCHSLEDMISERILGGRGFIKGTNLPDVTSAKAIPLDAITASQSLKPYARSLSHELRTPMQGVIGMLDIMSSTVLDAMANQQSDVVRSVFKDLKKHIEVVQDSSRRAVEAADNVVHAYDLNMQMPETFLTLDDPETRKSLPVFGASMPGYSAQKDRKRRRSEDFDSQHGSRPKRNNGRIGIPSSVNPSDLNESGGSAADIADSAASLLTPSLTDEEMLDHRQSAHLTAAILSSSHRQINTRDFIKNLVYEALRNGHPTNEVHSDTELGEIIEVQSVGTRGETQRRTISVEIDTDVPESIITEEQYLQFALQKLVDNAIKFTEDGRIRIAVKIADSAEVVEVWVVDTGCGITEDSRSHLFKPHFQEDASISRSKDGLGLSLFNAKAHVRKYLGGDVTLERSDTNGPSKGSEFLIRLPILRIDNGYPSTPLVGTPQISNQTFRPLFLSEEAFTKQESVELASVLPNIPSRLSTPKPSPSERIHNKNLAQEYPLNILIAEDNPINRNVAIGTLKRLGYSIPDITVAFDGVEAVKHFKESLKNPSARHFDVVLMDIWMPNMDGYEAATQILDLARSNGLDTRILAVTADITDDCNDRAKAAGMQALLAKPYKVLDMEKLIMDNFVGCC